MNTNDQEIMKYVSRSFITEDVKQGNVKLIHVGETIRCKADFERLPISTTNNPLHVAFKAMPWQLPK